MEDVDLTPQLYDSPVALRGKEVSANVGKSLFKDVHSYFQIINIETDEDIIGFEGLSRIKKEKYIKYDQSVILSKLKEEDIYETGDSICDITIALSEQELTQKRTYPKLIDVLGDVGGLMEVFFTFFKIISSFLMDNLYETSLVNHLFSFDLDKKIVMIKQKNNKKKDFFQNKSTKIRSSNKLDIISPQNSLNNDLSLSNNKLCDSSSKNKIDNNNLIISKPKKKKKKLKFKVKSSLNLEKSDKYKFENQCYEQVVKNEKENNTKGKNLEYNSIYFKNSINSKDEIEKKNIRKIKTIEKRRIINKIKINKACMYLCFLCSRKIKNIQNILLDEGMKIISQKLDIINLFKNICRNEIIQKNSIFKEEIIEMSENCKINLQKLSEHQSTKF